VRRVWNGRAYPKPRQMRGASYDFSTQKVNMGYIGPSAVQSGPRVQRFLLVSSPKETSRWEKRSTTVMRYKKKSWLGSKGWRQTSMTRGYRIWFQDLINVWIRPATMLNNKVMYRQFIHSVAFEIKKCCTCLRPLYLYSPDTLHNII